MQALPDPFIGALNTREGSGAIHALAAGCAAALLTAGCVQTVDTYSGTATLLTNGASSPEVSAQSIRFVDCSTREHPLHVLDLGDRCYVAGKWTSRAIFVGESGGTCELARSAAASVTIRLTDVTARFPSVGRDEDPNVVDLRIGGDLVEEARPPRHVLYTFSGNYAGQTHSRKRCAELGQQTPTAH